MESKNSFVEFVNCDSVDEEDDSCSSSEETFREFNKIIEPYINQIKEEVTEKCLQKIDAWFHMLSESYNINKEELEAKLSEIKNQVTGYKNELVERSIKEIMTPLLNNDDDGSQCIVEESKTSEASNVENKSTSPSHVSNPEDNSEVQVNVSFLDNKIASTVNDNKPKDIHIQSNADNNQNIEIIHKNIDECLQVINNSSNENILNPDKVEVCPSHIIINVDDVKPEEGIPVNNNVVMNSHYISEVDLEVLTAFKRYRYGRKNKFTKPFERTLKVSVDQSLLEQNLSLRYIQNEPIYITINAVGINEASQLSFNIQITHEVEINPATYYLRFELFNNDTNTIIKDKLAIKYSYVESPFEHLTMARKNHINRIRTAVKELDKPDLSKYYEEDDDLLKVAICELKESVEQEFKNFDRAVKFGYISRLPNLFENLYNTILI
jgi:hypothetical protein